MSKLFIRQCVVTVQESLQASGANAVLRIENRGDGQGLRVAFVVKQSIDSKSNTADVTIYNLNDTSRGKILKETPIFTIEAGYRFSGTNGTLPTGLLFSGKASFVHNQRADVGWETVVSAEDGREAGSAIVNESLAPGAKVADIIKSVGDKMKINVTKALAIAKKGDLDGALKQFANGVTLSGPARMELDKLTNTIGADWSIQNGELQILFPNQTNEISVVLSPDTGLVGSPMTEWKKIETKGGEKSTSKKLVLKAKSLLQPTLKPGCLVTMKSRAINGDFRCISVTHTGDTDGEEWHSEVEAISLGTAATVPTPSAPTRNIAA